MHVSGGLIRCAAMTATYKCPKCQSSTCSFVCYKSHNNSQCHEEFCRISTQNLLKETKVSPKEAEEFKRNVLPKHSQAEDNNSPINSYFREKVTDAIVAKLAESDCSLSSLNPEELKQFQNFVSSAAIPTWNPIWMLSDDLPNDLVTEVNVAGYFDALPTYPSLIDQLYFASAAKGCLTRPLQDRPSPPTTQSQETQSPPVVKRPSTFQEIQGQCRFVVEHRFCLSFNCLFFG